jgi:opacity protein-like surface antigen
MTFKMGRNIDENKRFYGFIQNIDAEDATFFIAGLAYDYLFGHEPFQPFLGIMAGYGSFSGDEGFEGQDIDIAGIVYGLEAGINVELQTNASLEAGYRMIRTGSGMSDRVVVSGHKVDLEIDDIRNLYLGFNYRF